MNNNMNIAVKKKDQVINTIKSHENLLSCPICHNPMFVDNELLKCDKKHTFDISKKGYINLLTTNHQGIYTKSLFESRNIISKAGFFNPMLEALERILKQCVTKESVILDAGCGEGSHLTQLFHRLGSKGLYIGSDISKDSIQIATRDTAELLWLVADLKKMPLSNQSVDVILNILSPASYEEFHRILNTEGRLIKVIPGKNYLKEIRGLIESDKKSYSNASVLNHLSEKMEIIETYEINYKFNLTSELAKHLMEMTPLTNHQVLTSYVDQLKEVTVDYMVVVAKF
ncbi:MAG: methyltransferase domain-containing protein [Clostridia bacterium]|nr:methyltransferase domain-containing protein [Clostridia bacterium]